MHARLSLPAFCACFFHHVPCVCAWLAHAWWHPLQRRHCMRARGATLRTAAAAARPSACSGPRGRLPVAREPGGAVLTPWRRVGPWHRRLPVGCGTLWPLRPSHDISEPLENRECELSPPSLLYSELPGTASVARPPRKTKRLPTLPTPFRANRECTNRSTQQQTTRTWRRSDTSDTQQRLQRTRPDSRCMARHSVTLVLIALLLAGCAARSEGEAALRAAAPVRCCTACMQCACCAHQLAQAAVYMMTACHRGSHGVWSSRAAASADACCRACCAVPYCRAWSCSHQDHEQDRWPAGGANRQHDSCRLGRAAAQQPSACCRSSRHSRCVACRHLRTC